jgi:hypothetical protein
MPASDRVRPSRRAGHGIAPGEYIRHLLLYIMYIIGTCDNRQGCCPVTANMSLPLIAPGSRRPRGSSMLAAGPADTPLSLPAAGTAWTWPMPRPAPRRDLLPHPGLGCPGPGLPWLARPDHDGRRPAPAPGPAPLTARPAPPAPARHRNQHSSQRRHRNRQGHRLISPVKQNHARRFTRVRMPPAS